MNRMKGIMSYLAMRDRLYTTCKISHAFYPVWASQTGTDPLNPLEIEAFEMPACTEPSAYLWHMHKH